jgi:hypothetical protein
MKYYITISCVFLSVYMYGQIPNPPNINDVFSITPKWSYITEDTNWYRLDTINNLQYDQYSKRGFYNKLFDGDDCYILEFASGFTHSPSLYEGYLLHKLDLDTGEPHWVLHNNFFSGNEYAYTPLGGHMHFLEDGNIAVNGFKSLDPLSEIVVEGFDTRVYTNVMRQTISPENGTILEERIHLDTARVRKNRHPSLLLRETSGESQVKYFIEYRQIDNTMRTLLNLYGVDPDGVVSEEPLMIYEYDSFIPTENPQFSYPTSYHQIDLATGVAIFGRIDPVAGGQPTDVKLVFFDTSNLPAISIKKEVSVLDLFPQPQHTFTSFAGIYPYDGEIMLFHKSIIGEKSVEDEFTWFARFDTEGNLLHKVDRLSVDGEDLDFIFSGDFIDGDLYCIGLDRRVGVEDLAAYHILKFTEDGVQTNLGKFFLKEEYYSHRIVMNSFDVLDNNDILVAIDVQYPIGTGIVKGDATYIVRFDGEDLGLTTSTAEIVGSIDSIKLYPNPAQDMLNIKWTNINMNDWDVLDIIGQSYKGKVSMFDNVLSIHSLPAGAYFVKVVEDGQESTLPFIKR